MEGEDGGDVNHAFIINHQVQKYFGSISFEKKLDFYLKKARKHGTEAKLLVILNHIRNKTTNVSGPIVGIKSYH